MSRIHTEIQSVPAQRDITYAIFNDITGGSYFLYNQNIEAYSLPDSPHAADVLIRNGWRPSGETVNDMLVLFRAMIHHEQETRKRRGERPSYEIARKEAIQQLATHIARSVLTYPESSGIPSPTDQDVERYREHRATAEIFDQPVLKTSADQSVATVSFGAHDTNHPHNKDRAAFAHRDACTALCIADGVSSDEHSERTSRHVVNRFVELSSTSFDPASDILDTINTEIKIDPTLTDQACTAVAVQHIPGSESIPDRLDVAWIGDPAGWLVRANGDIEKLVEPQTISQLFNSATHPDRSSDPTISDYDRWLTGEMPPCNRAPYAFINDHETSSQRYDTPVDLGDIVITGSDALNNLTCDEIRDIVMLFRQLPYAYQSAQLLCEAIAAGVGIRSQMAERIPRAHPDDTTVGVVLI
jgi:serine/threonine protein phosphatase PrpC